MKESPEETKEKLNFGKKEKHEALVKTSLYKGSMVSGSTFTQNIRQPPSYCSNKEYEEGLRVRGA
jgi:hypothetical protein